jgi:hypothetical protein
MHLKIPHDLLDEWARTDPPRLRAVAHQQADRLAELVAEVEPLRRHNDQLREQLDQARQRIRELENEMEQLQREATRQAAPFRLPDHKRSTAPRRPGRKPGHPGFSRPVPDHVDEHIEVPLHACPHCGGPVVAARRLEQYIEELPPVRPHVTHLITWEADCPRCVRRVRSSHPLQVSTATGAAGTHLGPRALATAAVLNKAHGLTMRKTTCVLETLFGLRLTPGGLALALHRVAAQLHPHYQRLLASLPRTSVLYADETSWWVGGPQAWLRVFATPTTTLYLVDDHRDRATITELLGPAYAGVLVSDCLNIYDDATPLQHKCYAHHHKAIAQAMRAHPQAGQGYLEELRALLHAAQALKALPSLQLPPGQWAQSRQALDRNADRLLQHPRPDPYEERVRQRLSKQRDHLFTFLDHPDVDATNNLAERQLRPAVIARKLSCGNKTPHGAQTWQTLCSLAATCRQRQQSFLQYLADALPLSSIPDTS